MRAVSARHRKTYGLKCGVTRRNLSTLVSVASFALLTLQAVKAEGSQLFDLRVEIDPSIYSSELCQNLVALHSDREVSPWGMIFAKPSRLCTYPAKISKAYSVRMWRLVLNELEDSLRLTLCRPIKRRGRIIDDCPWSVAFEKTRNWRDSLKEKSFIFLMVAGLHEKLAIRDFTLTGYSSARPEPRFESELLQPPPKLISGKLSVKNNSGRLLFTPSQVSQKDGSTIALWWMQTGDKSERSAAFAAAADNAGHTIVSATRAVKPKRHSHTPPPLAAPPPSPLNPIRARELGEAANSFTRSTVSSEDLSATWDNWWNGVWQTRAAIMGLPVSRAALSRVPALGAISIESRHLLYRSFSVGVLAQYSRDREGGELLVNTSLKRETQVATGLRTTHAAGAMAAVESSCGDGLCTYGLGSGYRAVSTEWSYDREKTTLKVWTPSGEGLFLEPWFQWSSAGQEQPNGFIAEARYTDHLFGDAQSRILSLEGAWHWGAPWATVDLGVLRISGWDTGVGLRIGSLEKTGSIGSNETGTSLNLAGFWLSLKVNLEELVETRD